MINEPIPDPIASAKLIGITRIREPSGDWRSCPVFEYPDGERVFLHPFAATNRTDGCVPLPPGMAILPDTSGPGGSPGRWDLPNDAP